MSKAQDIDKGDWITVNGKPVKVTHVKAGRGGIWDDGFVEISYKRGTRSGMLRRPPKSSIKRPGRKS